MDVDVDAHDAPGPDEPAGPPWIDPTMQQEMSWRDGDIVVSVPVKSGTTWMMNIVHQLRSGGDAGFADVYAEVPWIEFLPGPDARREDLVAGFDAMPRDRRRAFKTHSAPEVVPYQRPGAGPDVRYVVVVRNPEEAIASVLPFLRAHSDEWFDLWQVPKEALAAPDLETFVAETGELFVALVFGFVAGWWPLRHESNVLLLHFADLKADHEGSVRRVADFLGFAPTDAQWPAVLEYTSFAWMKAHEDKFEARTVAVIPFLEPGGMVRKGKVGASAEDGVTEAIAEQVAERGRRFLPDEQAFEWCYRGGSVPD
jgi:aryl sulfotransferase